MLSAWERREMNYEEFRTAVCDLLGGLEKEWDVVHDWGIPPVDPITGNAANSDAEMEWNMISFSWKRRKECSILSIPFPVKPLFNLYQKEGWECRCPGAVRSIFPTNQKKTRGVVDYGAKLNEEGKKLYETLRSLRARKSR